MSVPPQTFQGATERERPRIEQAISSLRARFAERVSTGESVRAQHGRGEAHTATYPPDAVVWPPSKVFNSGAF
jgi:D-lactate dehydrogenase (cytochrome)